jgi:hypothetical protein
MSIAVGTRIGTYEITATLGKGGMGEVYRAHDSKLNRDVALKILPEAFAGDPERSARFEREAKALAALNHPNIAHVYDAGTSGATSYLVMELVAGDDLSELIARGPIAVANALAYADQIADALETAHAAGIIHRDLKPANIKIRPDGTVKVLDFGLAKLDQDSSSADPLQLANSPTITSPVVTARGLILGTAAYMSPEQANGRPVDRRSDVWAFGAVLYEMLTGRRAFDGKTVAEVSGAVVHLEPDWSALPAAVSPAIRALLHGCLVKDRSRRIADISTARFVIANASSLAGPIAVTHTPARRWPMALTAGIAVLAAAGAAMSWPLLRSESAAVTRHTVTPAEDQAVVQAAGVDVALSPGGAWMVYVGAAPGGGTHLLRRELDDLDAKPIPGSEGASAPVVSPDGRSIAFRANGAIRTLPIEGGPPFTLVSSGGEPAWGDDGNIYYSGGNVTYRVSAKGGEPIAVSAPAPNVLQLTPDALPGGQGLIVTLLTGTAAQARIAVVGPGGGPPREILKATMARYANGHIVYATSSGTLMAAPFSVRDLAITGPAVPLAEGVAVSANATSQFAVSQSGALVYGTGIGFLSELVWVNRAGAVTSVDSTWRAEFGSPVLSPDGTRVAVAIQSPETRDIWIAQLDRGPRVRITLDGDRNDYPAWSSDGRSVTFASDRKSPSFDLWTKRSDGSGEPALEVDEPRAIAESLWSSDGKWFVHRTSTNEPGAGDILGRRLDGAGTAMPIVATRFTETSPAISPNSRWIAYVTVESGRNEVVVAPFPNAGDSRWPVSVGGGSEPAWSRDGRELFYRNGKDELVSVRVETAAAFSIGATSVLFAANNFVRQGPHRQYDVAPDGQRFLMVRPIGAGRQSRLVLLRNALRESVSRAASP